MNNIDTINVIINYLTFEEYMYSFSLICKDFKFKRNLLYKKNCANSLAIILKNKYYSCFSQYISIEKQISKNIMISNFINKLKNDLLKNIPFEIYQFKRNRYLWCNKYIYSNNLSIQYISYCIKIHCVYRCSFMQYNNISNNLTVKALIY